MSRRYSGPDVFGGGRRGLGVSGEVKFLDYKSKTKWEKRQAQEVRCDSEEPAERPKKKSPKNSDLQKGEGGGKKGEGSEAFLEMG